MYQRMIFSWDSNLTVCSQLDCGSYCSSIIVQIGAFEIFQPGNTLLLGNIPQILVLHFHIDIYESSAKFKVSRLNGRRSGGVGHVATMDGKQGIENGRSLAFHIFIMQNHPGSLLFC